jgi:hypothetical protein
LRSLRVSNASLQTLNIALPLSRMRTSNLRPQCSGTRREEEVPPRHTSWDDFMDDLETVFGDSDPGATARHKIRGVKQAGHMADVYIMNFEEYEFEMGYDDTALIEIFKDGMNVPLLKKIYALPTMPTNLKEWKQWAHKLDRQWREVQSRMSRKTITKGEVRKFINKAYDNDKKASTSISSSTPATPSSQKPRWWQKRDASTPTAENMPMDVDKTMKKTTQCPATGKKKTCFRCSSEGHMLYDCPSPDSRG